MRLGIFGGTFDPPHIGHLILAAEAYHSLNLDQVLWVITPDPPHKQGQAITPLQHRLDMVEATLESDPAFALSHIEIDRPGPQYVVDTMYLLRQRFPDGELIYLIGGDSLSNLPNWYRPRQFLALCSALGVMRRPEDKIDLDVLESALTGITPKIQFIEAPMLQISSRDIRERVKQNKPFRYYITNTVYQIIQERHLYRD